MSDQLLGVIVGGLLTGAFVIVAQVLAARNQADAARDTWNRNRRAQRHDELEKMGVDILRYIQEIDHAVANLEAGDTNMTAEQFIDTVNAAARGVMVYGYSLIVRMGPDDPTPPLIGQVITEARAFSGLYHVNRNPPATAAEKKLQAQAVSAAAKALRTHVHEMVKADADAS